MPSYTSIERLEIIMRYLNNTDTNRKMTQETIALNTGIPYASVRKTMVYDYPQCFDTNPYGGFKLPDPIRFPVGIEFNLKPEPVSVSRESSQANRGLPKINPEYFDQAMGRIMREKAIGAPRFEALSTFLAQKSRRESIDMDQYWIEYNMARAWLATLQAVKSPDPIKKLGELVEKFDTTIVYKSMGGPKQ